MTSNCVRLSRQDLASYSSRYSYPLEDSVTALVPTVKSRGCLTLDDLKIVGGWKSHRIRSRVAQNDDAFVQEVTHSMLQAKSIRLAVYIPQALFGVGMPVASTLLHWFHEDPYPILDFRALWSMGFDDVTVYSLDFWESYVNSVRQLAQDWNVDMRTLDQALWQYSKEHE